MAPARTARTPCCAAETDARRQGPPNPGSAGRIWVESERGEGARFTFTLPAAGAEPQGVAAQDGG